MSRTGEPELPKGASYRDLNQFDQKAPPPTPEEELEKQALRSMYENYDLPEPIIPRSDWGAKPMNGEIKKLKKPIRSIRYTYTKTDICRKKEDCIALVQKLQQEQMESGSPDINYNFLVGGDGAFIFEGRGWEHETPKPAEFENIKDECIDVAFIGNYELGCLPFVLEHSGLDIVKFGQQEGLMVDSKKLNLIPLSKASEKKTHTYVEL